MTDVGAPLAMLSPNLLRAGEAITSSTTGNTYRVGEQIADGFHSDVYSCSDVWDNALVIKCLRDYNDGTDLLAAGKDEINKLLHVRHPNIAFIMDAFVYQNLVCIVSERCSQTLVEMMKANDFQGIIWIRPIARCLLQAVHFAHVQGVIHCDIHLRNVMSHYILDEMVPAKYQAIVFKLADFGIARLAGEPIHEGKFLDHIRPPEAIDALEFGPADHRVDVYHSAMVLMQILLGKERIFSREEILAGVSREVALSLPTPYSFALEKALRRHVPYRTENAMELWRDLNSPIASNGGELQPSTPANLFDNAN
jgi:eukaryotic-like serine/threonine-protein kinase